MNFDLKDLPETFRDKVQIDQLTGCWNWTAHKDKDGYGGYYDQEAKKPMKAHRYSYLKLKGPLLHGMVIDHTCSNPKCTFPGHLDQVSQRENIIRSKNKVARGAASLVCWRCGADYVVNKRGTRECQQCIAETTREWYRSHPEAVRNYYVASRERLGKPLRIKNEVCPNCGGEFSIASSGRYCKPCKAARVAEWYKNHPNEKAEMQRRCYEKRKKENPEAYLASLKKSVEKRKQKKLDQLKEAGLI